MVTLIIYRVLIIEGLDAKIIIIKTINFLSGGMLMMEEVGKHEDMLNSTNKKKTGETWEHWTIILEGNRTPLRRSSVWLVR